MSLWHRVMVTGHRPQHLDDHATAWLATELPRVIAKMRDEHGMGVGISGMALGVDQWFAYDVIVAGIDLWAFIPFPQQPDRWGPDDRRRWWELRERASWVHMTASTFSVGALHRRNDQMLERAQAVIAVHDQTKATGGTASCVEKAQARGLPILHLDPRRRETRMRVPR